MTHKYALSRLPILATNPENDTPEEFVLLTDHLSILPVTSADIQRENDRDPILSHVKIDTVARWSSEIPIKFQT